jgi:hypothetical protein
MADALDRSIVNSPASAIDLHASGTSEITPQNLAASQLPGVARDFSRARQRFEQAIESDIAEANRIRNRSDRMLALYEILRDVQDDTDDLRTVQSNAAAALGYERRINRSARAARTLARWAISGPGAAYLIYEAGLGVEDILHLRNGLIDFARSLEDGLAALHRIQREASAGIAARERIARGLRGAEREAERIHRAQVQRRSELIGQLAAQDVLSRYGRGPYTGSQMLMMVSFVDQSMLAWRQWASGYYDTNMANEAFRRYLIAHGVEAASANVLVGMMARD